MQLQAQVASVCQVKGCWMVLDLGGGTQARVTFKDYGFFVPMDIVGKEAGWGSQVHYGVLDAMAPETADKMYDEIKEHGEPAELLRGGISPVIGTHIGPGAVGIAFYNAAELG